MTSSTTRSVTRPSPASERSSTSPTTLPGEGPARIGPVSVQDAPSATLAPDLPTGPRVLFLGDLAPTGFGTVTRGLGAELLALGLDVRFISQNDLGPDLDEPFRDVTVDATSLRSLYNVLSGEQGSLGPSALIEGMFDGSAPARMIGGVPWGGWKPQAAILLGDYAATRAFVNAAPEAFASVPVFHYCPVEGTDLPPRWRDMWQIVRPVAMSKFGADRDRARGGPPGADGLPRGGYGRLPPRHLAQPDPAGHSRQGRSCSAPGRTASICGPATSRKARSRCPRYGRCGPTAICRASGTTACCGRWSRSWSADPEVGLVLHCGPEDQGGNLHDTISKIPDTREVFNRGDEAPYGYAIVGREHPQVILVNSGRWRPRLCARSTTRRSCMSASPPRASG